SRRGRSRRLAGWGCALSVATAALTPDGEPSWAVSPVGACAFGGYGGRRPRGGRAVVSGRAGWGARASVADLVPAAGWASCGGLWAGAAGASGGTTPEPCALEVARGSVTMRWIVRAVMGWRCLRFGNTGPRRSRARRRARSSSRNTRGVIAITLRGGP